MAVKVMITDDHSLIREGLKHQVETVEGDFQVLQRRVMVLSAWKIKKSRYRMFYINMPRMNGLEVLQKIKDEKIDVKILVLTVHNEV